MNELEKWYKVYALYKDTPFIGFIEEYFEELFEQSNCVCKELSNFKNEESYNEYFTLEDTLELSSNFLSTIDRWYPEYLNEGLNNGAIDIYDKNDDYNIYESKNNGACFVKEKTRNEDKIHYFKTISLPLEHNIDDVYALVHELFHSVNSNITYNSNDFRVLTESVSITYEFILYDYLKQNNICSVDNIKPIEFRIYDLLKKANKLSKGLNIFKKVKENINELKNVNIGYIIPKKDETEEEKLERERKIKLEKEKIFENFYDLRKTLEYYLGTLIAIVNFKRYKDSKLDIKTIEEYNHSLKYNEELESLNILFDKFPSIEEVKEAMDYILNEINNSRTIKIR